MTPSLDVIAFDVNETLSDMSPIVSRFTEVGASEQLAGVWFASLLRDGFATALTGDQASFVDLAEVSCGPCCLAPTSTEASMLPSIT